MKALFGLLLFLCLASLPLCLAQAVPVNPTPLTFIGTSDVTQPPHVQSLYIEEIPDNSQLNLNISFNFNTTVCINYLVPVPFSANWGLVCSCYLNLTNLNGSTIITTNSTSSLRRGVARASSDVHPIPNYVNVQAICPNIRSGTYFVSVLSQNVTLNTTVVLTPSYTTCDINQAGPLCSNALSSSDNTPIVVPVTQGQTFIQYTPINTPQSLTVNVSGDAASILTTSVWLRIGSPAFNSSYSDVICGRQGDSIICESLNPPALNYIAGGVWFITLQFGQTLPLESVDVVIEQTTCTAAGNYGPTCNVVPTPLITNLTDVVEYTPPVNGISYYIVPFNTSLNFSVTVDGNAAAPALIVGYDNLPTLDQFLLFVNGSSTNVVNIIPTQNLLGPFVIGVVGTVNITYSYFLTPCPNGCKDNNHGACVALTGICNCRSEYESLDCSELRDSFKVEYIVLISIGGALVLAIVIGVPIYCYLHRRKEYERV